MISRRHIAGLTGLMTLAGLAIAAPASAAGAAPATSGGVITVTTPASGGPFTVTSTSHRAGQVRFHFVSHVPLDEQGNGGSDVSIFGLKHGVTIKQVEQEVAAQQGPGGAASTRWLTANTNIYGGSAIAGVGSTNVTAFLPDGTFYLVDVNAIFSGKQPVPYKELHIYGTAAHGLLPSIAGTIDVTSADTFHVTSTKLAQGNYLIRNVSDTIHFVSFSPVKPGTTDADITKAANQEINNQNPDPNPYLNKTSAEAEVLSPGQQQVFSSRLLTPGTYDLECYIADDETGMPHFFMGMHKIIVIK